MPSQRIEERHRITEFDGDLLAETTTKRPGRDRWVTLSLYRLDSGGYLIHRIGESLIYHTRGTRCRLTNSAMPSGEEASLNDLPDDAVPCPRCQPDYPENLDDHAVIRYEFPRHSTNRCANYTEVIQALTDTKHTGGVSSSALSGPAADLLSKASQNDPEFAAAPKPVERIN